jgi:hypothetical protein
LKKSKKTRGKHGKKEIKKEAPIPTEDDAQIENQQSLN